MEAFALSEMTYEELRQAQADEYGEYVAVEAITVNGVRAFNTGDPVPRGHVTGGIVDESQVARRTTKAAAKAKAAATEGTD